MREQLGERQRVKAFGVFLLILQAYWEPFSAGVIAVVLLVCLIRRWHVSELAVGFGRLGYIRRLVQAL